MAGYQDSKSEARCAELKVLTHRTQEEEEELSFLEDYLRDKPRLEIEKLKRRGQYFSPGNTAADVARALKEIGLKDPLLPQTPTQGERERVG